MTTESEHSIQAHYRSTGLLERILAGLREAGKNPDAPTIEDLAPADEFHSLGRVATKELAGLAALEPGTRVLDVGSGLGGPARFLAAACECDVTGVDLMPEFCAVASELSRRAGLAERARFRQGDALALPFGDGRPLDFPVPWASEAEQSHLIAPEALRALLGTVGLREHVFRDVTKPILAWQQANIPPAGATPPLGMHLVLGVRHAEKRANSSRALHDGRIAYVQGVFLRA